MSHRGSFYSELPSASSGATGEERREVTAVSIPGRFLPPAAAAEAPAGGILAEAPEPSAEVATEVAAAVHRLVASTDDAAIGLTGFCWDRDDEPAALPSRPAAAFVVAEENTPLPAPARLLVDFPAEPNATKLGPRDSFAAPSAVAPLPLAAPDPIWLPSEAESMIGEAAAPPVEAVRPLPEAPSAAAPSIVSAVPAITSEAAALPEDDEDFAEDDEDDEDDEDFEEDDEDAALTREAEVRQIYAASLAIESSPALAPVVPEPEDAAWAPVGFSPELMDAPKAPVLPVAAAARSMVSPVSVATATPAEIAPAPANSPASSSRPTVIGAGVRRLGQIIHPWGQAARSSGKTLASSGLVRLRASSAHVRLFRQRVRSAVAQSELRQRFPLRLRPHVPWILGGGSVLALLLILLTAHSCSVRAKQKRALQHDTAPVTQLMIETADQVGGIVPPQAVR